MQGGGAARRSSAPRRRPTGGGQIGHPDGDLSGFLGQRASTRHAWFTWAKSGARGRSGRRLSCGRRLYAAGLAGVWQSRTGKSPRPRILMLKNQGGSGVLTGVSEWAVQPCSGVDGEVRRRWRGGVRGPVTGVVLRAPDLHGSSHGGAAEA